MKKLMIAAAAAMLGIAAQAATFNWYIGEMNAAPVAGGWSTTAIVPGDVAKYSVQMYLFSDEGMTTAVNIGDAASLSSWDGNYMLGASGEHVLATPSELNYYYGKAIVTYAGTAGDQYLTSQNFMFVVANTEAESDIYISLGTGPDMSSLVTTLDGKSDFNDQTYGAFSAAGWTAATSTPEPTSGLLLLLGMGALALRRRRA